MAVFEGNWNYPTPVWFGPGRIADLAKACTEAGVHRPLLVTDKGLGASEIVRRAVSTVEDAGLELGVFDRVDGNPTGEMVDDGVAVFRGGAHDGVIGFGGGSALDVAKAVAMMAGQTRPLFDFEDREDWWTRVDPAGIRPVVAVPTTSGTGSEVGRASVITDSAVHTKKIIFHPRMLPVRVICDPELTFGLPGGLTAATGIDALSHNLEAWFAPGFHPLADGIALEGIELVHQHLERAVAEGSDVAARSGMMAASLMGATAFQKGLGGMHAMAHPIGALTNAHHGLTNAVVMPYVLAMNRAAIAPRAAVICRRLDLPNVGVDGLIEWVLALREKLDIPPTLEALGVPRALLGQLAAMAVLDPSAGGNPVSFTQQFAEKLFERSFEGNL